MAILLSCSSLRDRWVRRRNLNAFPLTAAAAGCLTAAHGVFWGVVNPVNVEMMQWPLDAIPRDWTMARRVRKNRNASNDDPLHARIWKHRDTLPDLIRARLQCRDIGSVSH
jgi:hypothetical protein